MRPGESPPVEVPGPGARVALGLIAVYRRGISPFVGSRCRFHPSCSAYAAEAIARHGLRRGARLALRRVGRCHPWSDGGYDPVPPEPRPPAE